MPNTAPILASTIICAVDQNGNPVRIVVDTTYDPPRIVVAGLVTSNEGLPGIYTEKHAYDGNGIEIYQGWASPGTATSSAGWAIARYSYSGTMVTAKEWADGTTAFTKIWDSRAGYTYA